MFQVTAIMIGVAMLLVLCVAIVAVLATLIIRRLVTNISESVRDKKHPSHTENAVISEKTHDDENGKYFITFNTQSGKTITSEVSRWEYSMFEKSQNVIFTYRENTALDIKLIK